MKKIECSKKCSRCIFNCFNGKLSKKKTVLLSTKLKNLHHQKTLYTARLKIRQRK